MIDDRNDKTLSWFGLLIYRIAFSLVMVFGVIINKKLFKNVKEESTGERGKVFQKIMKNYAIIQSIGWPSIWAWLLGLGILLQNFGPTIPACVYANGLHIGIFSYIWLRTYVGLNSLILALGRYIFVVHDRHVLHWGVETVAKVLIRGSFIIPLLMALLSDSVLTLEYNGWLAQIQEYETECYSAEDHVHDSNLVNRTTNNLFKSPLYTIFHSLFPSWFTSGLYVLNIVLVVILFSNISEGIIYVNCAVFVFRYLSGL